MENDYSKNKSFQGKGRMNSDLKYRVTISDPTDNGSVKDTEREFSKNSPYVDISKNWSSVTKG